jgi:hypothetical protein
MLEPSEKFGGYFNIDTPGPFMEVAFLEVAASQQGAWNWKARG